MPFEGDYTQAQFAQALVDDYKAAGVPADHVWPQSFSLDDVLYWVKHEPKFGKQAVYLDERVDTPEGYIEAVASLAGIAAQGVKIVAPPIPALLELDANQQLVPSDYADAANAAGLGIITWTLKRSGLLSVEHGGYYYASIAPVIDRDGVMLTVLDALVTKVGVRGVFSDWPATVTYYASCMGL
jgi:glycerophosphoryl diester phosphodiesterase